MSKPFDPMVGLAKANMELALKLAQTWRETGQRFLEIAGQSAEQSAAQTRSALVKGAGGEVSLFSTSEPLQGYFGQLETVRETTAKEIEAAIAEWRDNLSSVSSSAIDAVAEFPPDSIFGLWLGILPQAAPTASPEVPAQ